MVAWPGVTWREMLEWTESQLCMFTARAIERVEKQEAELKRDAGHRRPGGDTDTSVPLVKMHAYPRLASARVNGEVSSGN